MVRTSYRVNEPAVVYQAFTGEVVLINLETGSYYTLAKVGAELWSGIATGASFADLERQVAGRYDQPVAEIRDAIAAFLQTLLEEELIVPTDSGAVAPAITGVATPATNGVRLEGLELQKYTDMQELLALDPVHDVDETGWPAKRQSTGPGVTE